MEDYKLKRSSHYFKKFLSIQGETLSRFETNHIMMMYFAIHGLDLLQKLPEAQKTKVSQYVLSLQISTGGWAPSSFYTHYQLPNNTFNLPHIVFTYSAINILHITGDLSKINKDACINSIQRCEKQNGAYSSFQNTEQADLRFVYAAVSICHALNDFSRMNTAKVVEYINSCFNFDGGYSLRPHCESHSGAIYCAIASLKLLGLQPPHRNRTLHFLASRQTFNLSNKQVVGVQGRVGKLPDSCYSFWVGASIQILTGHNLLNPNVQLFVELCYKEKQYSFGKYPENQEGDPLHTVHSIVGLKIVRNKLNDICLERGVRLHDQKTAPTAVDPSPDAKNGGKE